jgi:hypothetical protein
MHWRMLLTVGVLFGVMAFGARETRAGNPWVDDVPGSPCANWIEYRSRPTFLDQIAIVGIGRCSPERLHVACRLAERGAPVRGLKLCPAELCPSVGRALIGLGLAAVRGGQLSAVYRLCPQQW